MLRETASLLWSAADTFTKNRLFMALVVLYIIGVYLTRCANELPATVELSAGEILLVNT